MFGFDRMPKCCDFGARPQPPNAPGAQPPAGARAGCGVPSAATARRRATTTPPRCAECAEIKLTGRGGVRTDQAAPTDENRMQDVSVFGFYPVALRDADAASDPSWSATTEGNCSSSSRPSAVRTDQLVLAMNQSPA